jgi:branched-chain amino acid transport system substrate-binding protein
MLTPYATSPAITDGRPFVFRSCFSDTFQGEQLAKFARGTLKASTAAIYADGGQLYSKTLAEAFRKSFTEAGGTIVVDEKMMASASSFKEQVEEVAAKKPDIVFLPVYEQTAARFINESVLRGVVASTFLGGDGWGASRTFQEIVFRKDAAAKAFWVSHYSGDFSDRGLAGVAKKFASVTGASLNASSAVGFDALMIAVKAVTAAGDLKNQRQVADAIRSMPAYRGLSGTIRYEGAQDPKKSLFIRRIDNDKMGFVTEMKP